MTSPAAQKAAEALRQLRDAYVIYVPVAVSQRTRKLIDEALAALEAEDAQETEETDWEWGMRAEAAARAAYGDHYHRYMKMMERAMRAAFPRRAPRP